MAGPETEEPGAAADPAVLLAKLARSRAAHLVVVTKALNKVAAILTKNPAIVTAPEPQSATSSFCTAPEACRDPEARRAHRGAHTGRQTRYSAGESYWRPLSHGMRGEGDVTFHRADRDFPTPMAAVAPRLQTTPPTGAASVNQLRLPKMDLPTIYAQWTGFIELFKAAVDRNTAISSVQKLQ